MSDSRGLGKGLGALLGNAATDNDTSSVASLPLSQIENFAGQPRKNFDEEALDSLAQSIREHGVIQPLTVRKLSTGYYQIIAGERRWRAARMAGLTEVPVVIIEANDKVAMEMALVENLQRENLSPLEEAEGYQVLMEQYSLTQEEVAQKVSKSRPAVANSLRLLSACDEIKEALSLGTITSGHARALLPLDPALVSQALKIIQDKGLDVRRTEALVKELKKAPKEIVIPETPVVDYYKEAGSKLANQLGRNISIVHGKRKGKIEIEYYDNDDLNVLLEELATLKKRATKK